MTPINTNVVINKCAGYDITEVEAVIRAQLELLGAGKSFFTGKKVVIKPNLVIPASPDKCIIKYASERGLCPSSVGLLKLTGDDTGIFKISDFAKPDTRRSKKLKSLPRFLSPRPFVSRKKCIGCGICCENCPGKTIFMKSADGAKKAEIKDKDCIRCFCCQELCPAKAIMIKKHFIFKLLS